MPRSLLRKLVGPLVSWWAHQPRALEPYATEEDWPFVRCLRDDPDDDLTRLVFADWLDEHDRPFRAALLRADIQGAPQPKASETARQVEHWLRGLPTLPGVEWVGISRGSARARVTGLAALHELARSTPLDHFVSLVLSTDDLGDTGFAEAVRRDDLRCTDELTISGRQPLPPALLDWVCSGGARLAGLRLSLPVTDDDLLHRLAAAPALGGLRHLEINGGAVTGHGLVGLLRSTTLNRLHSIALRHLPLQPRSDEVKEAPVLGKLTAFTIEGADLGADVVAAGELVRQLSAVRSLRLSGSRLPGAAVAVLAQETDGAALTDLDLSHNPIGDRGTASLAGSRRARELRQLDLRCTGTGDHGARCLAGSDHLEHLERLDLGGCEIREDGFLALVRSPLAARLRWLSLVQNPVSVDPPEFPWWRFVGRLYV